MDSLQSDARFALRTFARRPGMILVALATLSLGIGSSTAMFSVIDSVLMQPLDYPEPDELHAVYTTWPDLRGHPTLSFLADRGNWSWPEYWLVEEEQQVFSQFAAYGPTAVTLSAEDGRPEEVQAGQTSWELFPLLGATTHLGRVFDSTDGERGDRVVLLSYGAWRDRFGSRREIIGESLRLDDEMHTVVGVLSEGFQVVGLDRPFWLPRAGSRTDAGLGNHGGARALGRLVEGVSTDRARDEIQGLLRTLPPEHGAHGASVFPFHRELTRSARPVLLIMLAASALLLFVACGNVAAVLLGAGIDRERELAVRGAVGATRGRLIQLLLTEGVLLSAMGALGGVLVAAFATQVLVDLAPAGVPRLGDAQVDARVLLVAVCIAATSGILFGLIPALSLSSTEISRSMGSGRTTARRTTRLQSWVVVGELALATALLTGGTLLVRTVSALNDVNPGFDTDGLVVASLAFPFQRFQTEDGETDSEALRAYEERILDAIESLPGVTGAHTVSSPPFFGWRGNNGVLPEGWSDPENNPVAERRFVTEGYFTFMGLPLVEGRDFERQDFLMDGEPVVIISEGLAQLAWPGESALGRTLGYWERDARVIGVAANIRDEQLQGDTELAYYAPNVQEDAFGAPVIVRTQGDPAVVLGALRDRIWSVDPQLPVTRMETMDQLMGGEVAGHTFRARLMGVFALLAASFSLLGVYGVTSRAVGRRRREMALRVALGAEVRSVHNLVTAGAVRLAVVGALVGILAAVVVGGVLDQFLWGVSRTDPLALAAVGLGLPLLAALAAIPPARRATRVDPATALRAE